MRLLPVLGSPVTVAHSPDESSQRVEGSGGTAVGDDLEGVQQRLLLRREDCFDRIDDAISELLALHEVGGDEIRARVEACILREEQSAP